MPFRSYKNKTMQNNIKADKIQISARQNGKGRLTKTDYLMPLIQFPIFKIFSISKFFFCPKIVCTSMKNNLWREKSELLNLMLPKLAKAKVLLYVEFDAKSCFIITTRRN